MNKKHKLSDELGQECADLKALVTSFNAGKSRADSMSQEEIGLRLNMTQGSVSSYLNGVNSLNLKFAVSMATLLGVQVDAFSPRLARQHAEAMKVIPSCDFSTVKISRLDVSAYAGHAVHRRTSSQCFEQIKLKRSAVTGLAVSEGFDKLRLVEAFCDSMQGSFNAGDSLLVDTGVEAAETDGVYLLRLNGQLFIRRLQSDHRGGYLMGADNRKYLPIPITASHASKMEVIGRVVAAYPCVQL